MTVFERRTQVLVIDRTVKSPHINDVASLVPTAIPEKSIGVAMAPPDEPFVIVQVKLNVLRESLFHDDLPSLSIPPSRPLSQPPDCTGVPGTKMSATRSSMGPTTGAGPVL
jgi:hypothetical protein